MNCVMLVVYFYFLQCFLYTMLSRMDTRGSDFGNFCLLPMGVLKLNKQKDVTAITTNLLLFLPKIGVDFFSVK